MRRRKTVLVVGAGWDQAPIIAEARRQGHFVVALDGNPRAYGMALADRAYVVSTRDCEGVLAIAQEERIDAVTYMITESALRAVYHVAQTLKLPGPSWESVEATVGKGRMREIFQDAGIPNPRFGKATTAAQALQVAQEVGLPLVLKPADAGGQLGLAYVAHLDEIVPCFAKAQAESAGGEVILEEMMNGDEVNAVAIVIDGKVRAMTVSSRLKHPTMAFGVVMRHLYPPSCPANMLDEIYLLNQQMAGAMRVCHGILFPQLIVTPHGPRVVEIGERIPGGVMKELFEYATGYDLVKLQLDMALGQLRELEAYRQGRPHSAVTVKFLTCEPGPLRAGTVSQITGRERAMGLDGVVEAEFYNDPTKSQVIRPLRNGRDRFYFVIAVGATPQDVIMRSNEASRMLDFLDEAGNSLFMPEAVDVY